MAKVDVSDFTTAARKLKAADGTIRTAFNKQLRQHVQPLLAEVVEEGVKPMPSRGGLRVQLAKSGWARLTWSSMTVRASLGKRGAWLGGINAGTVRHPVFGNRRVWRGQSVPAGTFDRALEAQTERLVPRILDMFDEVGRQL